MSFRVEIKDNNGYRTIKYKSITVE